jgi:hypothetical protein
MLILAVLTIPVIVTNIHTAQAKSGLLDFAQGREDGKSSGKSDFLAGSSYNDRCPSGSGVSYCAGYTEGYASGWSTAKSFKKID